MPDWISWLVNLGLQGIRQQGNLEIGNKRSMIIIKLFCCSSRMKSSHPLSMGCHALCLTLFQMCWMVYIMGMILRHPSRWPNCLKWCRIVLIVWELLSGWSKTRITHVLIYWWTLLNIVFNFQQRKYQRMHVVSKMWRSPFGMRLEEIKQNLIRKWKDNFEDSIMQNFNSFGYLRWFLVNCLHQAWSTMMLGDSLSPIEFVRDNLVHKYSIPVIYYIVIWTLQRLSKALTMKKQRG